MSTPVPSQRDHVVATLRDLARVVRTKELSTGQLNALTAALESVEPQLDAGAAPERGAWWERGPDFQANFAAESPFRGTQHPWAPQMHVQVAGPQVAGPQGVGARAVGDVVLGGQWAGPPKGAHGGIIAGLFDEVIGQAASHAEPSAFVVTGRLTVRYRSLTPLDLPLRFEAHVHTASARALTVQATCHSGEEITATAAALMVVRRRRRQTRQP